jgi:hypothetical protein
MKHLLALLFFPFAFMHSIGQGKIKNTYTIHGHIRDWDGKYIYFSCKGIGVSRIWDSALIKSNTFKFQGSLDEPANGFITLLKSDRVKNLEDKNITDRLFVSPSEMTISLVLDSFHKARLLGTKYQNEFQKLEDSKGKIYNKIAPVSKLYDSLYEEYIKKSNLVNGESEIMIIESKMDSLKTLLEIYSEKCSTVDKAFFTKNPGRVGYGLC